MYLPDGIIVMKDLLVFVWFEVVVSLCEAVNCDGIG